GAASLPAGSTVSVLVLMGLYETKIVLPDPFDNVNVSDPYRRLIQINDMSGAGWVEINGDSFAIDPPVMFWPWAVDFDNSGKIYVANNMSSTDSDVILRFNNIHDASPVSIGSGLGSGIISVAIDRPRNIVYYATQNYLRQCDLNGIIDITLTSPSNLDSISALAVGADGTLYIGGSNTLGQGTVWRYNLLSPLSSDYYSGTYTPSDIEVKGSNIYVTYDGSGSTDKIVLLSDDLAFLDGYGMWVGPNPSLNENPGMFYNPRRFVAIRNDALIIIDDANTGFDFDKLVSIRNISGADWTTYGTEGKETGQFQFFYGC
ncbi:MAG: hypothetical protein JW807_11225, partial [Spirochaetes bacterium]|nr:hypothetical protein [Spirochaetota bacterium]